LVVIRGALKSSGKWKSYKAHNLHLFINMYMYCFRNEPKWFI